MAEKTNGNAAILGMENPILEDFINFPEELKKKCSEEEFRRMMTSHNSDVPIENVQFSDYPVNMGM